MIQVLNRAFDILKLIAQEPERPCGLGEIAKTTALHPATAARILKCLVDAGYVEQVGRKKGYILGPAAYMLSAHGPYRKDLVRAAEPALIDLVKRIQETAMLAVMQGNRRTLICEVEAKPVLQVRTDTRQVHDPYQSATGRLLLAHVPAPELETFLRLRGMPGALWPEVSSKADLLKALEAIRGRGQVLLTAGREVTGIAVAIRVNEQVVAALGVYLPTFQLSGKRENEILSAMRAAAEAVAARLQKQDRPREKPTRNPES